MTQTKLEFMIHNVGGNLTLKNTCFISNEEVIAPVVNEDGVLHLLSNSVQRRTQAVPATGCPFVSHGELDKQTFEASLFSCEAVDTPVCTSKALPKVDIPCVQKLDTIYEIEQDLTTSHHTRTYQLCPGLEYNIRSLSEGGDAHSEHSLPLIIGRSNIHVLCGADGKSSNGCKLKGGPMQVGIHDEYRDAQPIANAVIQGITFSGATFVNVLANTPGHVTIRDCVFSVSHQSEGCSARLNQALNRLNSLSAMHSGKRQPRVHLRRPCEQWLPTPTWRK